MAAGANGGPALRDFPLGEVLRRVDLIHAHSGAGTDVQETRCGGPTSNVRVAEHLQRGAGTLLRFNVLTAGHGDCNRSAVMLVVGGRAFDAFADVAFIQRAMRGPSWSLMRTATHCSRRRLTTRCASRRTTGRWRTAGRVEGCSLSLRPACSVPSNSETTAFGDERYKCAHRRSGAAVACGTAPVANWSPVPQGPRVERHLLAKTSWRGSSGRPVPLPGCIAATTSASGSSGSKAQPLGCAPVPGWRAAARADQTGAGTTVGGAPRCMPESSRTNSPVTVRAASSNQMTASATSSAVHARRSGVERS